MGDAFLEQSRQPAASGKQRISNAIKAGLGAGFKGSQNNIRQQKLQELEQYTKEVAGIQQNLAIQLGREEYRKAAMSNFAGSNYIDLKK